MWQQRLDTYIMDRNIIDTCIMDACILHTSACDSLPERTKFELVSVNISSQLSQLLCEYLFYVNQLCVKIFDIGHPTLGLVLLSSPLKGHDSLAVGSNW